MRFDHVEKRGGKYVVLSEDRSKELGTYNTEAEANERLRQVEAAKAAKDEGSIAEAPTGPTVRNGVELSGMAARRTDSARRVQRYDTTEPITSFDESPIGGLRVKANFSRTGVFPYKYGDGSTVREYRPPDEVFHPGSVATFIGAPVCDLHPADQVDTKSYTSLVKGHLLHAEPQPPFVAGHVDVNDAALIDLIRGGQRKEVSMGYTADFDPTPGVTPDGEPYDGVQRNIKINHVALGPPGWGRQGPSVALRNDSASAMATCNGVASASVETKMTVKMIKVDGIDCEQGSDTHVSLLQKQIDSATKRADASESLAASEKKRADDAAKLAADEKARADAAEKKADEKAIAKRVNERVSLISTAREALKYRAWKKRDAAGMRAAAHYLDDDEEQAATGDDAILTQAIQALSPSFDPKGKNHDQLVGALAALCSHKASEEAAEGEQDAAGARSLEPGNGEMGTDDDMEQDPGGEPLEPYDGLFSPKVTAPSGESGTSKPFDTPDTATPSVGNKKFGFDKGKTVSPAGDSKFAPRGQIGAPAKIVHGDSVHDVTSSTDDEPTTQEEALRRRQRKDAQAWRQPVHEAVYAPNHPALRTR